MNRFSLLLCILIGVLTSCAKDIVDLTGDITGSVKDFKTGELLSNCGVSISPGGKSTSTDQYGVFSFNDLEARDYTLSFSKSGYDDETKDVTVVAGQVSSTSVMLKESSTKVGSIVGCVKDYNDARLISNCQVSLSPGGKTFTTSTDGKYEFNGLTPGEYSLSFSKSGYTEDSKSVTVKAGEATTADCLLKAKSSFSLSETSYDFGDLEDNKTFYCYNNSSSDCSYSISNIPDWLSFSKTEGTVRYDSNDSFTVTVDRTKVGEGAYTQTVNVAFSGKSSGTATLKLSMRKVVITTPTVNTGSSAANITQNSFNISGTIIATGGAQIIEYGHCWSTSPSPTVNDKRTNLGITSDLGSYVSNVTGLIVNTTYYVRAYAKNSQGISYSDQITVTTQDVESDKWDGNIAISFAGGSGTGVDPYIIKTGGQLLLMKDYSNKSFVLDNNIDLDNHNWLPFEFKGNFDGNGHTIMNLYVNRTTDNQGLFSMIKNASVSNVIISGVKINAGSNNNIGALAGDLQYGEISNCSVMLRSDSKILGKSNVGGLVGSMGNGYADSKTISNCSVISDGVKNLLGESNVGGILGFMREGYNGQIERCSFVGGIKGTSKVGGIVGYEQYGKLNLYDCFVSGSIEGYSYVGGIFGACDHNGYGCTYIYSSKANVSITVSSGYAGGIFGGNTRFMNIIACYSDGTISSNSTSCSNICGIGVGADCELCYSTMNSSLSNYKQMGYMNDSKDCTGTETSDNITATLRDCYSSYANYYNFNNTWTWTGTVKGAQKSVNCPKLNWE